MDDLPVSGVDRHVICDTVAALQVIYDNIALTYI